MGAMNSLFDRKMAYGWLMRFVSARWKRLSVVLGLSVFATGLGLVQPWLTKILIDDGIIARHFDAVAWTSLVLVGVALLSLTLGAVTRRLYVTMSGDILFDIRETVFAHLQRLSPEFYTERTSGDLMTRLDGDIAEIQRFATDSLFALVSAIIALVGSLTFLIILNWQLALLAFILLPAQIIYLRFMRPRVEAQTRTLRERTGDITGFFMERLPAIKFIQTQAAEDYEARNLHHLNRTFLGDLVRLQMTSYFTGAVPGFLNTLSTAIVFVTGGYLVINGAMTLGGLIAFSAYLMRATGPVNTFMGLYVAYQRARVSLMRVAELTAEAPAVTDLPDARDVPSDARGELAFQSVSFRYLTRDETVLDRLDAVFPAGAKIGIRGASGVGKSTMIDLIHRFYDPSSGCVTLDGVDIRKYRLGSLRHAIGMVTQDTVLFHQSIAANIRYTSRGATDGQVIDAAQQAGIHDFIESLPQGYETTVGGRGMALSGGQRQRISIARVLLGHPRILILDEATSAVDPETEARIVSAIDRLFAGRTRILISHRAATLAECDDIYDMDQGKLVLCERKTL